MTRQPRLAASDLVSHLCKSVFICGSFLVLLCSTAMAQGGGKAEPNRIEFKRGTNSTTVSGVVRNDEEAEYVLSAKKGQRLKIKITSAPVKSSVCEILRAGDGILRLDFTLEGDYDANFNYSGVLPQTGDYFITVKRPSQARGRSRYRLTVTVK